MGKGEEKYIDVHSEYMQDIITKPPSWLLQRGISFIFLTIFVLIAMTAFIRYPQLLSAPMTITTDNAPKAVVSKLQGNIVKIKVKDGQWIASGMPLAYIESTGDHDQILDLLEMLKKTQRSVDSHSIELKSVVAPTNMELGELQGPYQNFYAAYLNYRAAKQEGIYLKKRDILLKEMNNITEQNKRIQDSYALQKKEIEIGELEYEKYKILADKKVISPMELQKQESLLIAKKQSIPITENNILNNQAASLARIKELSELDNQISEEKKKFFQAMNSLISEAENWKKRYVMVAPNAGYVIFSGSLQENQYLNAGSIVFYIKTNDEQYYGEMKLPQLDFGKIKIGQRVMIKVKGYQYQEYGYLNGKIKTISDIPIKDSLFLSRVEIEREPKDSLIVLRPNLIADAEIITNDQSILTRIWLNLTKSIFKNNNPNSKN
ncbi:HlyD family secretion protein [Sphingobacterium siyangense]|jgi:HlyD family secretion protein|uniref:HlyD family secretion protein n=1 Tax=Sphingobacterium siyangense TaxID=459529 RepID=UPI0028AF8C86|nr:HlyD family efflux transporter periplasmic adaptor subunit [Sphingobacterium siyangense]